MNGSTGHGPGTLVRLGLRLAALLVPGRVRGAWLREWRSEFEAMEREGPPSGPLSLVRGMLSDAWTVRRLELRPHAGMSEEVGMGRGMHVLRRAVRSLMRAPGFAALATLTLGIGLGSAIAVFSVVDHVLLRPLPYPDADDLVVLRHPVPLYDAQGTWPTSVAGYFHIASQARELEAVGNYASSAPTLLGDDGSATPLDGARVSTSFLRVIRAEVVLGRLFDEAEDDPGAAPVTILGHETWTTRFGADPDIIGRSLNLSGDIHEVIGVMAPGVHLPEERVDLWVPRRLDPTAAPVNSHYIPVLARLAPGATVASASREMAALVAEFPEAMPGAYAGGFIEMSGFTGEAAALRDVVLAGADRPLWAVLGAVVVILLLAAANVANLFLVRAEGRRREVAVQRALGASRLRVVETFLGESLTLAAISTAVGLALAALALPVLQSMAPAEFPRMETIGIDLRSVGVAVLLSLTLGTLLGLLPAVGDRAGDVTALRDGDRGGSRGAGSRARRALVALQMALAVVLLVSAGLMVRTARALSNVSPGFVADGAVAVDYRLPWWEISGDVEIVEFLQRSLDRVRQIPDVRAAGVTNQLPMSGPAGCWGFSYEGHVPAAGEARPCPVTRFVSDGYFEAMGIPIVEGRPMTSASLASAGDELIVSQGIADRFWDGDALGRGAIAGRGEPPYHRVSGVVGAVHDQGLDQPAPPTVYFPLRPVGDVRPAWGVSSAGTLVVRSGSRPPLDLVAEIEDALTAELSSVAVTSTRTLQQVVDRSLVRRTFTMTLLLVAALIATVLGCIGLYGVISYAVSQRRGEIGVRIALGAGAGGVTRMVLRDSLLLVVAGAAVGVLASLGATRLLEGLLFGVEGLDVVTTGAVLLVLGTSATLAAWLPARRAARVDPATSLRGG